MKDRVFTYYMDMPTTIRSFVVSNNDTSFTIIINAKIGKDQQLRAYRHEINHIKNGDYDNKRPVNLIELSAHRTHG
ncbi:MAG: hypothetical protein K2N41_10820 [Lachnospiraceae bacterium]|nr:hypothetical protein [Lachnospiraceae bacterium]MDE7240183.1 hypothetical protein [Lachnospiraceae bacterium]